MAKEYLSGLLGHFLGEGSWDLLELLKGGEELVVVEGCVFYGKERGTRTSYSRRPSRGLGD